MIYGKRCKKENKKDEQAQAQEALKEDEMGEKKKGQIIGGITWILERALVVDLTPTRKLGEVYGLYNMGGKLGNMLGPLVWGGTTLVFSFFGETKCCIALLTQ